MEFKLAPVEWSITPESMYYPEYSMGTSDLPDRNKTAGVMSRAFNLATKESVMIGVGAASRTRDKMTNINNNTMNYSLGRTF